MKNIPKVTVFIPVFNGEKYVKECLDSILNQTFADFECLIIDDCSTDGSATVIKSITDSRIRYVKNEKNLGIANTRNKGFDLANGDYVAFLDCDDISVPDRLQKQVIFMETHPEVGLCGGFMQEMASDGKRIENTIWRCPTDHESIARFLAIRCTLFNPTLITRRSVVTAYSLYHDPTYVAASDLDWYIRMAQITKLANIQEVLTYYRKHEQQITNKCIALSRRNSNNLHLGLMLEEIKKFRPDVQGEVKPITAEMNELTFFQNLVLVDQLMASWSVPEEESTEEFQVYDALKKFLNRIWRESELYLSKYTLSIFWIVKQSPFFKSLPITVQLSVCCKCILGLDRSFTKRVGASINLLRQSVWK